MWQGIRTRLIVPIIAIIISIFFVFILFLNIQLRDVSQKEIELTVNNIGENAGQAVRSPLFYGDYPSLSNILNPLFSEEFAYFFVWDAIAGNMAFLRDPGNLVPVEHLNAFQSRSAVKSRVRRKVELKGRKYLEFEFPAFVGNISDPIGVVVIGISQNMIQGKLFNVTRWIIMLGLITTLLVVGSVLWILQRFVQPLRMLSQSMAEFSSGKYTVRSSIRTRDEIGLLAQSFNRMAEKINEQIVSIESYSRDLERMVGERTQRLIQALEDLKDREIKLEQAKKIRSLSELVNAIAHQINNPMTIISGHVQLLESNVRDEKSQKRFHSIHQSINRIDRLIRDMTFFSSLQHITPEEKSITELIREVAMENIPTSIHAEYFGFADFDKLVRINWELMGVALRNIIDNSVKVLESSSSKKKKWIRFTVRRDEEWAIIEIEDNGGGFQDTDRAIEPFYTTFPERSGMGLTFAFHILQIHNGEIIIDNTKSGAMVRLILPLEP